MDEQQNAPQRALTDEQLSAIRDAIERGYVGSGRDALLGDVDRLLDELRDLRARVWAWEALAERNGWKPTFKTGSVMDSDVSVGERVPPDLIARLDIAPTEPEDLPF